MKDIGYDRLPERMRDGARMYVEHGTPPGGFLSAVLRNNLVDAFGKADDMNTLYMKAWAVWLYNDAPSECWGSVEKVTKWIETGGLYGSTDDYD